MRSPSACDQSTLGSRPEQIWLPGTIEARRADGTSFMAEASLSRVPLADAGGPSYMLVLRDVNDRLAADQVIAALSGQAAYLQAELAAAMRPGEILGTSAPMQRVMRDIEQVAGTDATVLVLGETGTGKELIARAIHDRSRRKDRPLVRVNCAALPSNLIESELFGHEKGAFTGATQRRDGRFALADGGTIFLDEVGELPLELQAKLLRVLQEGEFEPVGSSKTRIVDVRVVAATNRDLAEAVKAATFREDLYFRLNVFPIHVPPLRLRGDDVVLLAGRFAQAFAREMGRRVEPLSPGDAARLRAYAWPGNVRELQNVIERAVITAQDGRLNLARALPEAGPALDASLGTDGDVRRVRTAREIEAMERENLLLALETTGWKVAGADGAASLLGLPPSTVSSRMKTLGIVRPAARQK